VIIDLDRFVATEEPYWRRLEAIIARLKDDPWRQLDLEEVRELDYLYRRAAADLARVSTFSAEPEMRRRLEQLVARAFAEIHGVRHRASGRLRIWHWLSVTLPQTFRRQQSAMIFAVVVTMAGVIFGGVAVAVDPEAKEVIMPFSHLIGDPAERVAVEESRVNEHLEDGRASFAGMLMTHNTKVTIFVLALGMTWGVGTTLMLFYNGVVLGAVVVDYLLAGQWAFLLGWLLPHGVIEIPAILVGGQAGFVLARALLGRDDGRSMAARLRTAAPDVATLAGGAGLMLIWAGVIESYLSQYHEPVLPYAVKILIGLGEGALLAAFYFFAGRTPRAKEEAA
jgi:uncharacterized membrane protein SpoIIM required for sporulation